MFLKLWKVFVGRNSAISAILVRFQITFCGYEFTMKPAYRVEVSCLVLIQEPILFAKNFSNSPRCPFLHSTKRCGDEPELVSNLGSSWVFAVAAGFAVGPRWYKSKSINSGFVTLLKS